LDIGRPENHWDCESEAQPKLVAKHGDGVSRVTVVTRVGSRHLVAGLRTGRFVVLVCHVIHFEFGSQSPKVRARRRRPTVEGSGRHLHRVWSPIVPL